MPDVERRIRLIQEGWTFAEQESTRTTGDGCWIVSGGHAGHKLKVLDRSRSTSWRYVLTLASVISLEELTEASD